jgi:RNA polymerase sigma-70 factor (ECF subfamily)
MGVNDGTRTLSVGADGAGEALADGVLVGEVLGGRREAFEVLVRRYERSARGTCFAVLRDWHAAQDAAQEGFVMAYRNLRGLREPGAFGAWLLTIMRHRAAKMAGRPWWKGRGVSLGCVAEPDDSERGAVGSGEERREAVVVAVGRLPEHERVVVMLRYFEGMGVAEVARVCGLPVGTVTKQLSRAHERLRKALEKGDL